jgi:hypothetical protein
MSLRLKLNLEFDGSIVFSGFLPETKEDALQLTEGGYPVTIYLSDRKNQMSGFIGDIPSDRKQLETHKSLYCTGLTLEIEVAKPDPEVVASLETNQQTEKTEKFGREVFEIVLKVHNRLIDYFRNVAKMYRLKSVNLDRKYHDYFLNSYYKCVWLDSGGKWREFRTDRKRSIPPVTLSFEKGVDKEEWRQIPIFIGEGKPVQMRHVLIANSLEYLSQNNGRLAVVEAVTALESAVKQLLPKVILRCSRDAPQIGEKDLDKVVEKAGLRLVVELGLKLIMTPAGLSAEDIQIVGEAIHDRNKILHGFQRKMKISKAQQYVSAISRVIERFEHLTT